MSRIIMFTLLAYTIEAFVAKGSLCGLEVNLWSRQQNKLCAGRNPRDGKRGKKGILKGGSEQKSRGVFPFSWAGKDDIIAYNKPTLRRKLEWLVGRQGFLYAFFSALPFSMIGTVPAEVVSTVALSPTVVVSAANTGVGAAAAAAVAFVMAHTPAMTTASTLAMSTLVVDLSFTLARHSESRRLIEGAKRLEATVLNEDLHQAEPDFLESREQYRAIGSQWVMLESHEQYLAMGSQWNYPGHGCEYYGDGRWICH
mmetsp:Transcript_83499/g.167234  ORF Transcript_83499/g.167234 Transcript_83499/m.167234 type:complete len:255 (-) Transcript_83499:287-1051(-)